MGKVTGFLEIDRQEQRYEPASDRVRHHHEFTIPLTEPEVKNQAARCMDCGIPYCHGDTGCPVHNQIPDWNDLVYQDDWEEASRNLHSTNNFPEFTGRICPAPCEEACTLNLEDSPVAIKTVEQAIADKAIPAAGSAPRSPTRKPARRLQSSVPAPPVLPRRNSLPASATRFTFSNANQSPADCCATAFPTSRWKRAISISGRPRWKPKA